MDRHGVAAWMAMYERAWRSPGTDLLAELFTPDATYLTGPYERPIVGLEAIGRMWEAEREGPDEVFTMTAEVVAAEGDTAVARVEVAYGEPVRQEYRDLWVMRFDAGGRCVAFEEWPFWPPGSGGAVAAGPRADGSGQAKG
jgi:uncharacterized protein (TIGR02246 family)